MNAFKRSQLLKRKTHKWYYLTQNKITAKRYRKPRKRCQEVIRWLEEERWFSNCAFGPFNPRFPFRYYYIESKRNKWELPNLKYWITKYEY